MSEASLAGRAISVLGSTRVPSSALELVGPLDELGPHLRAEPAVHQRAHVDGGIAAGEDLRPAERVMHRVERRGERGVAVRELGPGLERLGPGREREGHARVGDRDGATAQTALGAQLCDDVGIRLAVGLVRGRCRHRHDPADPETLPDARRAVRPRRHGDDRGDEAGQPGPVGLAQLHLDRVHAGAAQLEACRLARCVVGLKREGERPAAVLAGGEGVERELGLAQHRAQVPAFERGLEAGPRAHGLVCRGAHDEAGGRRRLAANLEAQREVAADRDPGRLTGEHEARRVRRGVGRRGRRVDAGAGGQNTEHENGGGRQHDDRSAPQSVRPSTHSPTGSRRKPHDS